VFTDCKIFTEQSDLWVYPLLVQTGTNPIMNNCIIDCNGYSNVTIDSRVSVKDTSTFTFEGTKFKGQLLLEDTTEATIDTDHLWTPTGTGVHGMSINDNSVLTLKINTTHHGYNQVSNLEINPWVEKVNLIQVYDSATFTLNGNLVGEIQVLGLAATVLIKDVTAPYGACRIAPVYVGGAVNTTVITVDNSHLIYDFADTVIGLHSIEDTMGATINIINGSILDFSGHNGRSQTWGQPIAMSNGGTLYMRNSHIIQRCNDKNGYNQVVSVNGVIDIADSQISALDWDGLDAHACLQVSPDQHKINCTLSNVVFNNECGEFGYGIAIYVNTGTIEAADYICSSNLTNNTLAVNIADDMVDYATLTSQCPV